jgi:uncharacterized protein (DUF427 family)
MGLSWQQGPLGRNPSGSFLTAEPPGRIPYAERLGRQMSVELGGRRIATSERVTLLFEPGRYPVAYFPLTDVSPDALEPTERVTRHQDLGTTRWFTVHGGRARSAERAAWQLVDPPPHASILKGTVAFAWRAMDAFYEEDERVLGHAADPYHRIDVRRSSRRLTVHAGERRIADTTRPLVLYESGFAPRWYVPEADVDSAALTPATLRTFCPYKGIATYWDIGARRLAAWSYRAPVEEMLRIAGMVSFEPDQVTVALDGAILLKAPGQTVVAHGVDRNLTIDEAGQIHPA